MNGSINSQSTVDAVIIAAPTVAHPAAAPLLWSSQADLIC
jgi:hypothetical protein